MASGALAGQKGHGEPSEGSYMAKVNDGPNRPFSHDDSSAGGSKDSFAKDPPPKDRQMLATEEEASGGGSHEDQMVKGDKNGVFSPDSNPIAVPVSKE